MNEISEEILYDNFYRTLNM